MLQPKRVKYRRPQDGRGNKGNAHRGTQLAFGSFGIKTLDAKWLDSRQLEAARVAINRYMQREGQVWIRVFPDKPITRKPADVRMGKGKGDPMGWVAPVTPGRILFEVEGVPFDVAKEALRLGAQKLPVKTKFVVTNDNEEVGSLEEAGYKMPEGGSFFGLVVVRVGMAAEAIFAGDGVFKNGGMLGGEGESHVAAKDDKGSNDGEVIDGKALGGEV